MSHFISVYNNSCVKVPVDPNTKMPTTDYERKAKKQGPRTKHKRSSMDSNSTELSIPKGDVDTKQVKEFYESIPDYKDINHLTQEEFYAKLKYLREKKRQMLGYAITHLDYDDGYDIKNNNGEQKEDYDFLEDYEKDVTSNLSCSLKTLNEKQKKTVSDRYSTNIKQITDDIDLILADENTLTLTEHQDSKNSCTRELSPKHVINIEHTKDPLVRSESRTKRNHSACSISWNDKFLKNEDVDISFDKYFNITPCNKIVKERKSKSVPSSPVKHKSMLSLNRYKKEGMTVPKPFKMTLRDDDERMCNTLKCLSKSFSEEMLDRKVEKKRFRAKPVPVESRIPLYDKIMEDQAMRRAISKINSTAELQAQMKPFSFTEREELRPKHTCDRHDPVVLDRVDVFSPGSNSKKKFKARPIPKNMFSNYIYEKMKEEHFYRALNRRIRAEELFRKSSLPPSMAARDNSRCRSRMSTPGGLLSDLPTDTTSELSSNKSGKGKRRKAKRNTFKPTKCPNSKQPSDDFITTCPQPFHFSTANRADKKENIKRIYSPTRRSPTRSNTETRMPHARPLSAMDVPSVNRSNLAAVLRIETTKKKLEDELTKRLADQEYKAELKWRDHILRKKPAWQLVKNNHEEDIAMRLQTRRDEERLRREEFLHEMELMYGRVQKQPLLFERYYIPPKSKREYLEEISQEAARLPKKSSQKSKGSRRGSKSAPSAQTLPCRSRKVSINETTETINNEFMDYLSRMTDEEKLLSETDNSTNND